MQSIVEAADRDTRCRVHMPMSTEAPAMLGKALKTAWPAAESECPNVPQAEAKLWFQILVQTKLMPELVEDHKTQQPTV